MRTYHIILIFSFVVLFRGCYPEPVANFEYSYSDNVVPAVVSFTNLSTDADESYWNFGDNSTSTETNPTHTYEAAGTFTIALKVKSRGGESTTSKNIIIVLPAPVANFNFFYSSNVTPVLVSFTNLSTDADTYLWDFGDGTTSVSFSPTHTYYESGIFTIKLTATGPGGQSNRSKTISIVDPTTYSIQNLSSVTLYEVTSYYWDGSDIYDEVDHGTLNIGYQTAEVITEWDEIYVDFKLEAGGDWYEVADPYYMIQNTVNYCVINDDTEVWGPYTFKSASVKGLRGTRGNTTPLRIKDIIGE
jgi:PKD repeat protein